jgi:hypothetical protein
VAKHAACQAEFEQLTQDARRKREQAQEQLNVELQQQADLTTSLAQLRARVEAAQASCHTALQETYAMPVSRMSLDQAHVLCSSVTGIELSYAVFREHDVNGALLTTMEQMDFKQLFGIAHVGLCHRLVHCIRIAAYTPAPELFATDFGSAEQQLQVWLSEQDSVSEETRLLFLQARFDMVTCGDATASILGMAGIPLAARKALLMILHAQASTTKEPDPSSVACHPEVQQAVLEQVLQENKVLAKRLSQLQHGHAGGQATVPDEYRCPITRELMEDPVIAEDGQTYEREAIATWVTGHGTSPMTRQRIASMFIPNRIMKALIEKWRQESG